MKTGFNLWQVDTFYLGNCFILLCFASLNVLLLNLKTANPGELEADKEPEHLKPTASGQYLCPLYPWLKFIPCVIIINCFSFVGTLVEIIVPVLVLLHVYRTLSPMKVSILKQIIEGGNKEWLNTVLGL